MRRLSKNKNFIPNSFINERKKTKIKGERRGIFLLILVNLIIFPLAINKLGVANDNDKNDIKLEIVKEVSLKDDIFSWLEMEKYNVEGDINESEGAIFVNNIGVIHEIEKNEKFYINSIENLGENKYKLIIKRGA